MKVMYKDSIISFNYLWEYVTEDKEVSDFLANLDWIEKLTKTKPDSKETQTEQIMWISEQYKEKYWKEVPVNKKNDDEWIKSKLED